MERYARLFMTDGSTVEILAGNRDHEGRIQYGWQIRSADGRTLAKGDDLRSGVGAAVDAADMLSGLTSFIGAWVESFDYPGSENADLFPQTLREWAESNADELYFATMPDTEV